MRTIQEVKKAIQNILHIIELNPNSLISDELDVIIDFVIETERKQSTTKEKENG
jgi:hypothetical protein